MDLDRDAKRLLELTSEARTPSADDKQRIARRLAGALLLGTTSAQAAASATTKVAGTTFLAKWAVITVVAALGGAGYVGWRIFRAPLLAPATASTETPAALTVREQAAVIPGTAEPSTAHSDDVALPRDNGPRLPAAAKSPAPHATLPEELDLLHDAQAKWRAGNASAALALVAEHRARFPHSALGPERDALAVLSLCATNRVAEAKRLARRFLAAAPHSPLKTSVEESCGGK